MRRDTKLKEDNLGYDTTKYYKMYAINKQRKSCRRVYSFWVDNHIESTVGVCAALK